MGCMVHAHFLQGNLRSLLADVVFVLNNGCSAEANLHSVCAESPEDS